jgi:hypothetical protein
MCCLTRDGEPGAGQAAVEGAVAQLPWWRSAQGAVARGASPQKRGDLKRALYVWRLWVCKQTMKSEAVQVPSGTAPTVSGAGCWFSA